MKLNFETFLFINLKKFFYKLIYDILKKLFEKKLLNDNKIYFKF